MNSVATAFFGACAQCAANKNCSQLIMFVFLSGNIGSGKSTVLKAFEQKLGDLANRWTIVKEPSEEWAANGTLAAMYDGTLSAGEFQVMALAARVADLVGASNDPFVMAERSPWEDAHVFANTTLSGIHRINYDHARDRLMRMLPPLADQMVHIILEVDPNVAMTRIGSRARDSEHNITPEYLSTLDDAYKTFDPPGTVHRINANGSEAATLAAISYVL